MSSHHRRGLARPPLSVCTAICAPSGSEVPPAFCRLPSPSSRQAHRQRASAFVRPHLLFTLSTYFAARPYA
eukprot:1076359-Pleurochrysis_carterae.AAC.2